MSPQGPCPQSTSSWHASSPGTAICPGGQSWDGRITVQPPSPSGSKPSAHWSGSMPAPCPAGWQVPSSSGRSPGSQGPASPLPPPPSEPGTAVVSSSPHPRGTPSASRATSARAIERSARRKVTTCVPFIPTCHTHPSSTSQYIPSHTLFRASLVVGSRCTRKGCSAYGRASVGAGASQHAGLQDHVRNAYSHCEVPPQTRRGRVSEGSTPGHLSKNRGVGKVEGPKLEGLHRRCCMAEPGAMTGA